VSGGNDTTDKIFLLSIDEANAYFTDDSSRIAPNTMGDPAWWWLRSPGVAANYAAGINYGGDIAISGSSVSNGGGGVRPALWLNL